MGVKISSLPLSNLPLSGNELIPLVQGVTVKSPLSSLLTYLSGSLLADSELAALSGNFALKNTNNFFTASQTITGSSVNFTVGNNHTNNGTSSVVLGGSTNTIATLITNAVVAGGNSNLVSGPNSSIVGGSINTITSQRSVVLGGNTNITNGENSSVVGGNNNNASSTSSSVLGGGSNNASGTFSVVAAGQVNTALGSRSSVIGGTNNTASGVNSSVVGGQSNSSSGIGSIVLGGNTNTASASASIVLAGEQNTASGEDAVASGFGAVAYANGMHATSNGFFASPGDAQSIDIPLIGSLLYSTGTAFSSVYTGNLLTRLTPSVPWTLRPNTIAAGTIQVAVVAPNSQLYAFDFNFATHTINGVRTAESPSITPYLNNRSDTPRFPRFITPIPSSVIPVSVFVNTDRSVGITISLPLTGANITGQRANEVVPLRCVARLTGVEYLSAAGGYYS